MKKNVVTHSGIIKKIEGNQVDVAIMVTSGCASCEIKGACSVSEATEKSVLVTVNNPEKYDINQQVTIEMKQSLGTWAVLLGYIFPFLILLLTLILLINLNFDEGIAGIISISVLVPYYLVIYFLRNYLGSKFNYSLRQ